MRLQGKKIATLVAEDVEDLDRARALDKSIAQVDSEIDRRVYALYGLTEEEVKVVEGK